MALKKKPVTGMKDILPAEMAIRDYVIRLIKETYGTFGFSSIETPCVEHIENLSSKQGGENEKLIFKILKRGEKLKLDTAETEADLVDGGLRYDLTLPLSRYYSNHANELPSPFKALQMGNVWRADRPQRGRYRQFMQCDIDILGEPTNLAEITNDVQGVRYVKEKLEGVLEPEYADGLEMIMNSVDAVKAADFKIAFDPTLVRGMSYYTGPIFEISMDEFGGSVGGGGRYDEMIGKFTGNNTCACGFSIGFERIIMLLMERGFQVPQIGTKKALLIEKNMPAEGMMKVLKQAEEDRKNGSVVTIAVMKKNKKFQKEQLKEEGYEEIVEFFADRM